MSRTDKTNPWWVKAEEWEPVHHTRCVDYGYRRHWQSGPDPDFVCDLPKDPVVRNPRGPRYRIRRIGTPPPPGFTDCTWEPVGPGFPYTDNGVKVYGRPVGVRDRANQMERGIRAAWRNYRQKALSSRICEEGISGCVCLSDVIGDLEPPDPRHRHYALWDMW